jgi:hypothetical protein
MELETGVPSSRRDRLKEALIHRNSSRKCEEERNPMVNRLSPYVEDVVALIVDEDLPYDELRQILDDRVNANSSFVSEPFDEQEVPEIICKPLDEQIVPEIVSESFDQLLPEIVSEPFLKQVSGSVAEPVGAVLEVGPTLESVPCETSAISCDKSEIVASESDENSTIDEAGSHYSIEEPEIQEREVTFTSFMEDKDEIEVHLGETSIIVEMIGGKDINPTNSSTVAEDDDKSEATCVSTYDNTVDTDEYDSDASSWTSDSPLPELFKELMFQRLTFAASKALNASASAGIATWF